MADISGSTLMCKSCGGPTIIYKNKSVAECSYCGLKQSVPVFADEKNLENYNKASKYLAENEFEKAQKEFEEVSKNVQDDSAVEWSIALSRFGITYVKDPADGTKKPTINKMQRVRFTEDENYKKAIYLASDAQREIYQREAETIEQIQSEILYISEREEPYDIFISYKEQDSEASARTEDSLTAEELYNEFTKLGYKVFYSRYSLKHIAGHSYEPYIFAALNSAKVMILVGTKIEYITSPWVENEWSRFLKLKRNNYRKILIPVFSMNLIKECPKELSGIQALNIQKITFLDDLKNIINREIGENGKQKAENNFYDSNYETHEAEKINKKSNKNKKSKKGLIIAVLVVLAAGLGFAAHSFFSENKNIQALQTADKENNTASAESSKETLKKETSEEDVQNSKEDTQEKKSEDTNKTEKNSSTSEPADNCKYLWENIDTKEMTIEDIENVIEDYGEKIHGINTVQMLLNEMHARHGASFSEVAVMKYFMSKSWYSNGHLKPEYVEQRFNEIELKNLKTLNEYYEEHYK